ncbi:MAG TPA: DNA replication/repair protein RecF [Calditrichaeota bacterium]|nr:DNA replication/repair protein RecF [Calditrichota bacterium]
MILEKLQITHFRNISKESILFDKKVNILYGKNGQGKTSFLETIYILALTKSFKAHSDKIFLQHSQNFLEIRGDFISEKRNNIAIRYYYSEEEGKNIFLNGNKLDKFSDVIGMVPVVLLSLEDFELTYGLPAYRRRFLDILLSQVHPLYLNALQNYKRSLAQRNKLLTLIKETKEPPSSLEPWDEQLVKYGSDVVYYRIVFVDFLNQRLVKNYRSISYINEESIDVEYKSNIAGKEKMSNRDKIRERFAAQLIKNRGYDIYKESTSIGPHRDDLVFLKNGYPFKTYGSQGENKTFLIALKLIESEYVLQNAKEGPLLLLDDIFGELDEYRIGHLIDYITEIGQTFITTTVRNKFQNNRLRETNFLEVQNGGVLQ